MQRMFEFNDAAECFKSAYELNDNEESLESEKMAKQLEKLTLKELSDSKAAFGGTDELKTQLHEWKNEYLRYTR